MPQLHIRLSEADDRHLREQVERSGLSTSTFIRKLIWSEKIPQRIPEQMPALLRELSAIGNNINQIAKIANSSGRVYPEDIQEIEDMFSRLWRIIRTM